MKKNYISPVSQCFTLETAQIIAASVNDTQIDIFEDQMGAEESYTNQQESFDSESYWE